MLTAGFGLPGTSTEAERASMSRWETGWTIMSGLSSVNTIPAMEKPGSLPVGRSASRPVGRPVSRFADWPVARRMGLGPSSGPRERCPYSQNAGGENAGGRRPLRTIGKKPGRRKGQSPGCRSRPADGKNHSGGSWYQGLTMKHLFRLITPVFPRIITAIVGVWQDANCRGHQTGGSPRGARSHRDHEEVTRHQKGVGPVSARSPQAPVYRQGPERQDRLHRHQRGTGGSVRS